MNHGFNRLTYIEMDLGVYLQMNSGAVIDWDLTLYVILLPYAYDSKMRNNEDKYNGKDNNGAVDAEKKRRC